MGGEDFDRRGVDCLVVCIGERYRVLVRGVCVALSTIPFLARNSSKHHVQVSETSQTKARAGHVLSLHFCPYVGELMTRTWFFRKQERGCMKESSRPPVPGSDHIPRPRPTATATPRGAVHLGGSTRKGIRQRATPPHGASWSGEDGGVLQNVWTVGTYFSSIGLETHTARQTLSIQNVIRKAPVSEIDRSILK